MREDAQTCVLDAEEAGGNYPWSTRRIAYIESTGSGTAAFRGFVFFQGKEDLGAAIYMTSSASLSLFLCSFIDNVATTNGGAIYVESGNLEVYGNAFQGNYVTSGTATSDDIYNDGGSLSLNGVSKSEWAGGWAC